MDLDREETKQAFVLSKDRLGDIIFKNVGFRYGTRVEVFKDFSTRFQHAKVTAIDGDSGSEKSTLVFNAFRMISGNSIIFFTLKTDDK